MIKVIEIKLDSDYDKIRLIESILTISVRYKELRTYFMYVDGKWKQFIKRSLNTKDIEDIINEEEYEVDNENFNNDYHKDINIGIPPLFRLRIAQQQENTYTIYLIIHEIIASTIDFDKNFIPDLVKVYLDKECEFWKVSDFSMMELYQNTIKKLPLNVENAYPLSAVQLGIISASLRNKKKHYYEGIYPIAFEDFSFNHDAFENALNIIVSRHEILRTRFVNRFSCQIVTRHNYIYLYVNDISELNEDEQRIEILKEINSVKADGYKFNGDEMFKLKLYKIENNKYQIIIFYHYSIMDGRSISNFEDELFTIYDSLKSGEIASDKLLKSSYFDYVVAEQNILNDKEAKEFWQNMIDNRTIEVFAPISMQGEEYIDGYKEWIDSEIAEKINILSRKIAISEKNIFLAAFAYLIHIIAQKNSITIEVVSNGRPALPDSEKVLGCFLNNVPLKICFDGISTWIDIIQEIENLSLGIKQYENYPCPQITDIAFSYVKLQEITDIIKTDFRFIKSIIKADGMIDNTFYFKVKNISNKYLISFECSKYKYTLKTQKIILKYFNLILEYMGSGYSISQFNSTIINDCEWKAFRDCQKIYTD